MSNLYGGTVLFVDLTERKITKESTHSYTKDYLGGRLINMKLFYDLVPQDVAPLGPDNPLVFGVGPLGGTTLSTGRTEVTARSPETGLLGSSNFGGYFASELKYAGIDHIVVTGKAETPVYIWIENDHVEIKDASTLWGKDTHETPVIIRQEVGNPDVKIACIGQGGENLVRFATIQHGLGHAAGRTGMGAVMGAKNLKAIAVRGTGDIKIADPKRFLDLTMEMESVIKNDSYLQRWAKEGVSREQDEIAEYLEVPGPSEYALYKKYSPKRAGCFGCAVRCQEEYSVPGFGRGEVKCEQYPAFVNELKCYDIDTSLKSAILTGRYGVDTVSSALIIKWLMELYENGIITAADTDGISMEWGSPEAISSILDKMVFRQGIGDVLAEGILPAAKKFGRGSEAYANQVKGLPLVEGGSPEWLPQCKGGMLANVTGPRGDAMRTLTGILDFQLAEDPDIGERILPVLKKYWPNMAVAQKGSQHHEIEGKAELVVYYEDSLAISDLLSTCKYLNWGYLVWGPEYQAKFLSAGSGQETSFEDLFKFAAKTRNLERAYEAGIGLTRDQEIMPKRFVDTPVEIGFFKGAVCESSTLEEMKDRFYAARGWDVETGLPTEDTLIKYGLEDVAEDLKKYGKLPGITE